MFSRPFHPDRFLRSVYGTEPFLDYCRQRRLPFEQTRAAAPGPGDMRRWAAALAQLPHDQHAQVELELATVNEMAGRDAVAHLIEAADAGALPPDSIPAGIQVALWFFLHHPVLFHEVFLHHEIQEVESWRIAQAPRLLDLPDLEGRAAALTGALREFFQVREGTGRFCIVDAYQLTDAVCFVAQVADRLQYFEAFTDAGQKTRQRLRRALPVLFVYYPGDGTLLLKCHLRSRDRIGELCRRFGEAALDAPVSCDDGAFDLEVLKRPFHPLPDAADVELVRVKALHLRYPERSGRRQLKLETLSSDDTAAIDELLHAHVGDGPLAGLRVSYAELQVRMRVAGRSKNYPVRLWPNRCNLSQTPLGDRFRSCLKSWGLCHER